jgi:CoA:oxalate CoA-transferase
MPAESLSLLKTIRVLDMSRVLSGPFCSRILRDLGAEVIKIESGRGDPSRQYPPFKGGYAGGFSHYNAGKKSLGVNLRHPKGVDLAKRLVAVSDVLVENFRPGTLAQMGLGYPVLKEINPRIVLCSISGFGQTGTEAQRLAYTDEIQAYSGMDHMLAQMIGPDADPPGYPFSFADTYASLHAAVAILAALLNRTHTGEGQCIDISMLDCMVSVNDSILQKFIFSDGAINRPGILYRPPLRMKDGHMSAALGMQFERVAKAIGHPELLEDERFKTMKARNKPENFIHFFDMVKEWASKTTVQEATKIFEENEIPYSKVNSIAELIDSPAVRDRNMLPEVELPDCGPVPIINTAFHFLGKSCRPQGPPPRLGEHNREVLGSLLGLAEGDMDALSGEGILIRE